MKMNDNHNNFLVSDEHYKAIKNNIKNKILHQIKNEDYNEFIKSLYIKLTSHIFKNLEEEQIQNQKLHFNYQFWIKISYHRLIKKNANNVHNFINFLKRRKFITNNSKLFPCNQVLISINPLTKPFIHTDFSKIDFFLNKRDELIEKINLIDQLTSEKEELIYIYFRLFLIKKIPAYFYKYMKYENIFHIGNQVLFVVKLDDRKISNGSGKVFIPIKTFLLSKDESFLLKKIFIHNISSLLEYNDSLFSRDIEFYEKKLKIFCDTNQLDIKKSNRAVEFDYQFNNTAFNLTLYTQYTYPLLSLLEIEKLYPNVISKTCLEVERKNLEYYRDSPSRIDDQEIDLDEGLSSDYEIFEKFKTIKKTPKNKMSNLYLKKWYSFINRYDTHEMYGPMCKYVKYLLDLANKDISSKPISSKTLQSYLQRIFDYCFTIIVKSNDLEDALLKIDDKLKRNIISPDVLVKYENDINKFLSNEYNVKKDKINNTTYYNRSIIFEDELLKLVMRLDYKDKIHRSRILNLRRKVYVILCFHTGLRKSELQTRLVKDFYYVENKTFIIDVNAEGFRKSKLNKKLKNKNARRRVEFEISNNKLFNIVKEYLVLIEKSGTSFLFPSILASTKGIAKKKAIKTSHIDELNAILQKITNRYTVIHSFRHTYATNEISKLVNANRKSTTDIFELLLKLGHADFETTLKRYAHIDLILRDYCKNQMNI